MNYELAKQLKEAGFEHNWCSEDDCSCLTNGSNNSCFPTLSKLIEACGEEFTALIAPKKDMLEKLLADSGRPDVQWCAHSHSLKIFGFGSTPEEAVARLYLELNKKHDRT